MGSKDQTKRSKVDLEDAKNVNLVSQHSPSPVYLHLLMQTFLFRNSKISKLISNHSDKAYDVLTMISKFSLAIFWNKRIFMQIRVYRLRTKIKKNKIWRFIIHKVKFSRRRWRKWTWSILFLFLLRETWLWIRGLF